MDGEQMFYCVWILGVSLIALGLVIALKSNKKSKTWTGYTYDCWTEDTMWVWNYMQNIKVAEIPEIFKDIDGYKEVHTKNGYKPKKIRVIVEEV